VALVAAASSLLNFGLDIILVVITGGLWLIWIFVREMRRR
jgi:hypothetical protein